MFLKNCWYVAAFSSELGTDALITRQILGSRIVMYRTSGGDPVALLDQCPHRRAPLSLGQRKGDSIRCGYHGMVFAQDGRCTHVPGQDYVPSAAKVQTFPVRERYRHVWIWMGDPSRADERSIPEIPWAGDPQWATVQGYVQFAADYRLLTDNLLDLSHESYLHEGTIGNSDAQTIADYPVKVTVSGTDVIRAMREMRNIDPPPWFEMILNTKKPIDRWQTAIWAAPSFNMTDTGASPAGSSTSPAYIGRVMHLLTPETERSTHYFWSVSRNYRIGEEHLSQALIEAIRRTFGEDKAMLERQQIEIDQSGLSVPGVALRVDNAPVRARRLLDERIRREQEEGAVSTDPVRMLDDVLVPVEA